MQVAAAPAGLNWPGPLCKCPLVNTNRELKRITLGLSHLKPSFYVFKLRTDILNSLYFSLTRYQSTYAMPVTLQFIEQHMVGLIKEKKFNFGGFLDATLNRTRFPRFVSILIIFVLPGRFSFTLEK